MVADSGCNVMRRRKDCERQSLIASPYLAQNGKTLCRVNPLQQQCAAC